MDFNSVKDKLDRAKLNVEGLSDDMKDVYVAMLDNEEKELRRISEQTNAANIDRVATVFIPTIKKIARDSIIDKIVGIQPIKDRVALVKYVDYVYSATDATSGAVINTSTVDRTVTKEYSRDPGEGQNITRGIDLVIKEKEVKSRQRKLAGRWTFEAQDSANQDGYNIESEITKTLASKIVEEINFEVIDDLYTGATGATGVTWVAPQAGDAPATKDRKEKEIYYSIVDVAADIYDKTKRYPNWVICNPKVGAILKRTGDFVASGGQGLPRSIKKLFLNGTLNDEFDLFIVPNLGTNDILVGYKGSSEIESGYIYAPYIPLIVMDSFFNSENWTWIKSVGSSYAKSSVMTDLYGKVTVTF